MTARTTWWRRLGGLLACCLLVALVAGPAIDSIICEVEIVSHAAQSPRTTTASAETGSAGAELQDIGEACAHGHYHHANPYLSSTGQVPVGVSSSSERPSLAATASLSSLDPPGLERPPRA